MVTLKSPIQAVNHRSEGLTIKPHQAVAHRIGTGRNPVQVGLPPAPRSSATVGLQGIEASQSQNKKHKDTIKDRLSRNTKDGVGRREDSEAKPENQIPDPHIGRIAGTTTPLSSLTSASTAQIRIPQSVESPDNAPPRPESEDATFEEYIACGAFPCDSEPHRETRACVLSDICSPAYHRYFSSLQDFLASALQNGQAGSAGNEASFRW